MRAMSCLLPLGLVLTLSACEDSADSLADARELLLLSAISGEEDSLAGDLSASSRADEAGPEADRAAPPPMFRECDAEGEFVGLFEAYDADASGALDGEEPSEVEADHGGRPGGPRDGLRHLIGFVYDLDQSHSLEDSELAVIFEDFTARCGAIQASLLVEFDAEVKERDNEVGVVVLMPQSGVGAPGGFASGLQHGPFPGIRQQSPKQVFAAEL